MKRIFKSVAIWIVVGEALIAFVLWCMGFRITYAPELDNNWDAISAVAEWAGVAARTQNTIYLRLNYDEPSGTVVNVRKSMWIHPTQDRAISVREAARLQTFPDSFVFCGSKDKQYQQVGNAVPPIMAKSIAEKLAQILEKNLAGRERNG